MCIYFFGLNLMLVICILIFNPTMRSWWATSLPIPENLALYFILLTIGGYLLTFMLVEEWKETK